MGWRDAHSHCAHPYSDAQTQAVRTQLHLRLIKTLKWHRAIGTSMHGYLRARAFSLFPFQYSTQSSRDDDVVHVTPMANVQVEMKGQSE